MVPVSTGLLTQRIFSMYDGVWSLMSLMMSLEYDVSKLTQSSLQY